MTKKKQANGTLKVGDWAMLGDDVVQIKEVDGDSYEVSTGFINTSGRLSDRLYPLTLENKATADCVADYSRRMHDMCRGVNWPELASWIEYSLHEAASNRELQSTFMEKLRKVHDQLQDLERLRFEAIDIGVFRR